MATTEQITNQLHEAIFSDIPNLDDYITYFVNKWNAVLAQHVITPEQLEEVKKEFAGYVKGYSMDLGYGGTMGNIKPLREALGIPAAYFRGIKIYVGDGDDQEFGDYEFITNNNVF